MYLAQSYNEYFVKTGQDLYKAKKVEMPKPELYVVYTGNKGKKPDIISLSEEYFGGTENAVEVKAKFHFDGLLRRRCRLRTGAVLQTVSCLSGTGKRERYTFVYSDDC
jgi:hypothetical protein